MAAALPRWSAVWPTKSTTAQPRTSGLRHLRSKHHPHVPSPMTGLYSRGEHPTVERFLEDVEKLSFMATDLLEPFGEYA